MTILTKPFGDAKKSEKAILPLVGGSEAPAVPTAPSVSVFASPICVISCIMPSVSQHCAMAKIDNKTI